MLNLILQSRFRFLAVAIALINSSTLVNTAQAFVLEDMDKLENQSCLPISSCDKFDRNFIVNQNLANINSKTNISKSPQKKSLEDSRNLIDKIDDPHIKTEMLINLGLQYDELNELEILKQILNEALEVSQDVEQNSTKTLLMIKIATILIEIQELEIASEILDLALESSEKITDNSTKANLLMDLASKYKQIEDSEKAEIILAEVDIIVTEIENPPPSFPFKPTPLEGHTLLGTNLFFAKDTLANFNMGVRLSKRWATDEIDLFLEFFNSYDSSRDAGDKNRILFDIVTEYKHYFREKFFYFGNLAYLQDNFTGNDGRFSYFTGFGFNLWQGSTKDETFDMKLGIGDLFQDSTIKNKNAPFPVFQYALVYKNLFFTDWKFEQIFALEVPVRNTANYFADSRTIVTIPAIKNWSVFSSLSFIYMGIPELNEPNLSTSFTAGLRYDF